MAAAVAPAKGDYAEVTSGEHAGRHGVVAQEEAANAEQEAHVLVRFADQDGGEARVAAGGVARLASGKLQAHQNFRPTVGVCVQIAPSEADAGRVGTIVADERRWQAQKLRGPFRVAFADAVGGESAALAEASVQPITRVEMEARALASRLRAALAATTLALESSPFYTSPLPFWEMPSSLRVQLARAALVITKGDANYRRLLGDRHWAHDASFAELMGKYFPTSVAALRTCKSGVLVGVDPAVEANAVRAEPEKWLTGGKFGLVQLYWHV